MKRIIRGIPLSLLTLLAWSYGTHALAGSAPLVTITRIDAQSNGFFFVSFSANIANGPSCGQTGVPNGMAIDGTSPGGKVLMATIMGAYAMGKTVTATGTNVCDLHSAYETMWDVYTTN